MPWVKSFFFNVLAWNWYVAQRTLQGMHSLHSQMAGWYPGAFGMSHKQVKHVSMSLACTCALHFELLQVPDLLFTSLTLLFSVLAAGMLCDRGQSTSGGCLVGCKNKRLGCFLDGSVKCPWFECISLYVLLSGYLILALCSGKSKDTCMV